jgi:hypothetical protein
MSTASIATVTPRRKSLFFMETTPCLFGSTPPADLAPIIGTRTKPFTADFLP